MTEVVPLKLNGSDQLARLETGDTVAASFVHRGRQLRSEAFGTERRLAFAAPRFAPPATWMQGYHAVGNWIAGATATAPTEHGPSGGPYTEHLWPFNACVAQDYEGYPHNRYRNLEANLSDGNSPSYATRGYEQGDFLAAGAFTRGRSIVWEYTGTIANSVNADAMFEFVLEPIQPPPIAATDTFVGSYTGANRMRFLSDELGLTWSGTRRFEARIELVDEGRKAYSWRGDFRIYSSIGPALWSRPIEGSTAAGFDFLTQDSVLTTRFRVDRIANVDTYDATYQGLTTLQLAIKSVRCTPKGA